MAKSFYKLCEKKRWVGIKLSTLNKSKVIREILIDLQKVEEFFFPRHILHEHSRVTCSDLLTSKARVAPCREDRLTIPKLELTASLIGARLIRYLSNLFKFDTIYLWSDSKVTISWITSDRDMKDVYIANRVPEIKTLINHHHVNVMYVAYPLKIIQQIIFPEDAPQNN